MLLIGGSICCGPHGSISKWEPINAGFGWGHSSRRQDTMRHRGDIRAPILSPVTISTIINRSRSDRKSVVKGESVSVRVDLGGRRSIKNKKLKLGREK